MNSSSPKKVKIFVKNATILDCGVLFPKIGPRGRSWQVDVEWEGITDVEGVVFDFSLAKKSAKKLVDEYFDHRLMVASTSLKEVSENRSLASSLFMLGRGKAYRFAINSYNDGFCVVDPIVIEALSDDHYAPLCRVIENHILSKSPKNVTSVKVSLRAHESIHAAHYFSYTHSLKTHYGNCQRFHGHSNIIEVFQDGVFDLELSIEAATMLRERYLVQECYAMPESSTAQNDELTLALDVSPEDLKNSYRRIAYEGSQGSVSLLVPKESLLTMNDESTIEHIAQFVKESLNLDSSYEVFAYEGLMKGAIC